MNNEQMKLQRYEQQMRDNAYAIVQFAEKMEDLQPGVGEKALKGIVDYLKEHYNIETPTQQ